MMKENQRKRIKKQLEEKVLRKLRNKEFWEGSFFYVGKETLWIKKGKMNRVIDLLFVCFLFLGDSRYYESQTDFY